MKIRIVTRSKHSRPDYSAASSAGLEIRANTDREIVLDPIESNLLIYYFTLRFRMDKGHMYALEAY